MPTVDEGGTSMVLINVTVVIPQMILRRSSDRRRLVSNHLLAIQLTSTQDVDVLIETGNTICPGLKQEIAELTNTSELNRLGRTGLANFTCTNYISCVHPDADIGLADLLAGRGKTDSLGSLFPCAQLSKTGCGPDDYNFAYVRFGVVVRTMTNTVWYLSLVLIFQAHNSLFPGFSMVDTNMAL
jgi:hypothetical protein